MVIALNGSSDGSPSSLMALRADRTVKWRRDDLRGPVIDVSFSPTGELVVVGDDRVVRDDTAWLAVMSGTSGSTVRQRDLADLTVAGTGTTDVEYGADDNVYLQIVVGNRAVIQSFRFSDLQSIDEVASSGGYLGARQPLLATVGPYSSVGFFSYANGGLRDAVFKNASANIQSSSISPAGAVFALSNHHSACSGVEVMYVSPTTAWNQPVAQYAPDVASDCEAYDIASLPSGGAAVLLFLRTSLRILVLDESGNLVRAIARPISTLGDSGGLSLRSVQSFELKADGKGNLVLIMEGVESGCTAELRPAPCGFIRIETMTSDGTPVASHELHGDRSNNFAPNDDSVRLYRPTAFSDRDIDFATGLVGLAVTRAPYYVDHGRGTTNDTEAFVTVSLPVERRFWKDPPGDSPPVLVPSTTISSTSTSLATTTTAVSSGRILVSPSEGVRGTTFSLSYRCPTRTFPRLRITDNNNVPITRGYVLGLPVSMNGRDYNTTFTGYELGTYKVILICADAVSGSVTITVTATALPPLRNGGVIRLPPDSEAYCQTNVPKVPGFRVQFRSLFWPSGPHVQDSALTMCSYYIVSDGERSGSGAGVFPAGIISSILQAVDWTKACGFSRAGSRPQLDPNTKTYFCA